MRFTSSGYASSTPCPACGSRLINIIESRSTKNHHRRRKECTDCKHRYTTYEVSSHWYQEAQENARLRSALTKELAIAPAVSLVPSQPIPCGTCTHACAAACGFGFAEFGTLEAVGCVSYDQVNTPADRYIA